MFKVHTENSDHFVATGNSGDFKIAKRGLNPLSSQRFSAMCKGGKVGYARGGGVKQQPTEDPLSPGANADQPFGPEGVADRREMAAKILYRAAKNLIVGGDSPMDSAMGMANPLSAPAGALGEVLVKGAAKAAGNAVERRAVGKIPWGGMSMEEALAAAKEGQHVVAKRAGGFTGAPAWVTDPDKLQQLRNRLDAYVQQGLSGAGAYTKAKQSIWSITGGDPEKADQFSKLLGIYSPQSTQEGNLVFATRDWNKHALGEDLTLNPTRKRTEASAAQKIFANSDSKAGLGLKTAQYADASNPTTDLASPIAANDLWMARAYGYGGSGQADGKLTTQNHSFMNGENLLAMDRARAKGLLVGFGGPVQETQARIWAAKRAEANATGGPDVQAALPRVTGNETTSVIPGGTTGHLQGMSPELQQRFADDPAADYLDPQKRDLFYSASGANQLPAEKMGGQWQGQGEPNTVLHPLVVNEKSSLKGLDRKKLPPDPESRAILDTVNSWRSVLDAQDAGAYNFPGKKIDVPATEAWKVPGVPAKLNEVPWSQEGSGSATEWAVKNSDPRVLKNFDASPYGQALRERIGERNALEDRAAQRPGVSPPRKDLQGLRDKLSKGGWGALADHIDKNGYKGLPGIAVSAMSKMNDQPDDEGMSQGGPVGKLLQEHKDFFHVEGADGKSFVVPKRGLKPLTLKKIQEHFAKGGKVGYDEGGEAEGDQANDVDRYTPEQAAQSRIDSLLPGDIAGIGRPGTGMAEERPDAAHVMPALRTWAGPAGFGRGMGDVQTADAADTSSANAAAASAVPHLPDLGLASTMAPPDDQHPPMPPQGQQRPGLGAGAGVPGMSGMGFPSQKEIETAISGEQQAIRNQGLANAHLIEAQGQAAKWGEEQMTKAQQDYKDEMDFNNNRIAMYADQVAKGKIDPKRLYHQMGTGQKITSAIAMILGGAGAGMTHGPNLGLAVMEKALDRDMEAQKLDVENKRGLLNYHLQLGRNIADAHSMVRADLLSNVAMQVRQAAGQYGGEQAKANAEAAAKALDQDALGIRTRVAQQKLQATATSVDIGMKMMQRRYMEYQMQIAGKSADPNATYTGEEAQFSGIPLANFWKAGVGRNGAPVYKRSFGPEGAAEIRKTQDIAGEATSLLGKNNLPQPTYQLPGAPAITSAQHAREDWLQRMSELNTRMFGVGGSRPNARLFGRFEGRIKNIGNGWRPHLAQQEVQELHNEFLRALGSVQNSQGFGN